MVREERTIEVTLISATDLKKVKKFGREQKNYVSAYVYPSRREISRADPYGGVNPIWNVTLKLKCYENDLFPAATNSGGTAASSSSASSAHEMTLEIYSHGGGIFHTADKLVGTVTVPLQQVASAAKAGGAMPAFPVHLPTESGEVQGSLNLSVKLGAKRELGDYEDISTAPLSSYSDQVTPSFFYPQARDEFPSSQPSSYKSQGQSSYGNYPPASEVTPSSFYPQARDEFPSSQPSSYKSQGQSSGNYPPASQVTPSSFYPQARDQFPSSQPNSYNSQGQSSYGNYPPASGSPSADKQNSIAAAAEEGDFVTGYPAPENYAFAPLGQLPRERPRPETSAEYGPYVVRSPNEGTHYHTKRERRRERRRERKQDRREKKWDRRSEKIKKFAAMGKKEAATHMAFVALRVVSMGLI